MLLFKKRYFEGIRRGEKTTTLRYWRHRRARPGSVHTVPGLGKIAIHDVRVVDWADLTDADAQADGYESLDALRDALEEMYPSTSRNGRELYLVRFRYPALPTSENASNEGG